MNIKETDKQDSNYELIKRHEVETTPFTIVEIIETGEIFGTIGNYRLTEKFKTVEEAKTEMQKINWDRILQLIGIAIDKLK